MRKIMKPLFIFDFDDTIAHTDSMIVVRHANGEVSELTSAEFADYRHTQGDELDFTQFDKEVDGMLITDTVDSMEEAIEDHGKNAVYIVTARSKSKPVVKFLKAFGVNFPKVVAVQGSENKADWLQAMLTAGPWTEVKVWEDSMENIIMLRQVVEDYNTNSGSQVLFDYTHIA